MQERFSKEEIESMEKRAELQQQAGKLKTPFYFVRHGQTDWNKARIVMGQTDIHLNEAGIQQAQELAQKIAGLKISHIVSSPLTRAKQTAEIIAAVLQKPIVVIEELKEVFGGSIEGKKKGSDFEYWAQGGDIEGAESWADLKQRVHIGLEKALQYSSHDAPVLIVAHGGVYRALQRILFLELEEVINCDIIFHEPEGQWWKRSFKRSRD